VRVLITGSGGLIGSEACLHWLQKGAKVYGIDNNMRKSFFGPMGDVTSNIEMLLSYANYKHHTVDIRTRDEIRKLLIDILL